jgi:hypothetical protein
VLDDDRGDGSARYGTAGARTAGARVSGARVSGPGTFGPRAPGGSRASGNPCASGPVRDDGAARASGAVRGHDAAPAHRRAAGEALYGASLDLRHRLAGHQARLPDRPIAEQELSVLMARAVEVSWGRGPLYGRDEPVTADGLRGCLLRLAAALGSVSALAEPLDAVRRAVESTVTSLDGPR